MKTLNSLDSLGSLDSKGVLHAPMAAVLLVLTMTTLMIFGYFHHWRKLVEVQLKLDNCVADVAQDLRWNLNFIESTNLAMKSVRILIPPSLIVPGTTAVLKDALLALEFAQKGILGVWQVKRNVYRVKCRFFGPSDHLPDMSWERPLPDVIGQNALTWKEGSSKELEVQLVEYPRAAAARVSDNNDDCNEDEHNAERSKKETYASKNLYLKKFDIRNFKLLSTWSARWKIPKVDRATLLAGSIGRYAKQLFGTSNN